jgi:hypothetical protein
MEQLPQIIQILKTTSPIIIALFVVIYLLKIWLEKRIEGLAMRSEQIAESSLRMQEEAAKSNLELKAEMARTSLDLKRELRHEERGELIAYRVAVEEWEDFLQRVLGNYAMQDAAEANVRSLYEEEAKLFLKVKLAVVAACVYLQTPQLEYELRETVIRIRKLYNPLIQQSVLPLIDLHAQLAPLETKLKKFQASGGQDMAFAPTPQDQERCARLQAAITEELRKFSEALTSQYRPIAEQLDSLKEQMNKYIYRRVEHAEVDKA